MKSVLLSISLFCSFFSFSQKVLRKSSDQRTKTIFSDKTDHKKNKADGDTLFRYDFSDVSKWYFEDFSSPALDTKAYRIDTLGPKGSFSGEMGKIKSTTYKNNFAIIDSDAGYSNVGVQDIRLVLNETIDFSASPNVNICFQSYHRKFNDSIYIEFNVNNGGWNNSIQLDEVLDINDASANPSYKIINISSIVGGKANVQFRFRYLGQWDYAWMLDDIAFISSPQHEIELTSFTQSSADASALDYYKIPDSQKNYPGFNVQIDARNQGKINETDVELTLMPDNGNSNKSDIYSIDINELKQLRIDVPFLPKTGNTSFQLYTTCDGSTDYYPNNSLNTFQVIRGGNEFARHDGIMRGNYNFVDAAAQGIKASNLYTFYNPFWLQSVKGKFTASMSNVGDVVFCEIELLNTATNMWETIAAVDATISAENLSDYVVFDFTANQNDLKFKANQSIRVWIGHYPDPSPVVIASAQLTNPSTSFVQIGTGTLGYVLKAPMISLIEYPLNTHVLEQPQFNANVFPNPTSNVITVGTTDKNTEIQRIECLDLSGRIVKNTSTFYAQQKIDLDLSDLQNGPYLLKIFTTHSTITTPIVKN